MEEGSEKLGIPATQPRFYVEQTIRPDNDQTRRWIIMFLISFFFFFWAASLDLCPLSRLLASSGFLLISLIPVTRWRFRIDARVRKT